MFLLTRPTIAGFVITAIFYSLASSAFVFLLPVFAGKVLQVGAMMLGWLWSCYGAGMVLITLALAWSKQLSAKARLFLLAGTLTAGGAASFMLAGTNHALLSLLLVAVIGAGLAAFTPVTWAMLQELADEQVRGRVFAIFNTGAMSASMIGMVTFGWITDRLGPQISLLAMTAIFVVTAVACVLLWKFGDLQRLVHTACGAEKVA